MMFLRDVPFYLWLNKIYLISNEILYKKINLNQTGF
jgi:hypothetical protein